MLAIAYVHECAFIHIIVLVRMVSFFKNITLRFSNIAMFQVLFRGSKPYLMPKSKLSYMKLRAIPV
jgi:hypothetical protein